MCIRDRLLPVPQFSGQAGDYFWELNAALFPTGIPGFYRICLLYTSDAADERSSVDLGGRRIIKKKNN